MAEIVFNTEDSKDALRAVRAMLNSLLGEAAPAVLTEPVKTADCSTATPTSAPAGADSETVKTAPTGTRVDSGVADTTTSANIETADAQSTAPSEGVDLKGVEFNADYCGASKDAPFMASGKTKGQWKRKRHVSQEAYDEWYAGELEEVGGSDSNDGTMSGTVDTASAFGAGTEQTAPADVVPGTAG